MEILRQNDLLMSVADDIQNFNRPVQGDAGFRNTPEDGFTRVECAAIQVQEALRLSDDSHSVAG